MASNNQKKEEQIIIRAMHNPYFSKNVLSKDVGALIETPILKEIANTVVRHYGQTDELLTLNTLNIKLEERLKRKASQKNQEVTPQQLDNIYRINSILINSHEDNSDSLLQDLESYIHTKLANQAILEEAAKGNNSISERVEKRLTDINDIKLTGTKYEPLSILGDMDRRMQIYSQFGSRRIPSGLKPLDLLTGGGLEAGQIGLIAASSGSGKSTFLTNLSYYYAMVSNQNVLHISLEELDTDQILRFDRVMTNAGVKEIFNDDGSIKDSYLTRLQHFYSAVKQSDQPHGQIYFEKSTPLTLNVDDIRQMVNTVERENNCKIQVIILDYADLLKRKQYSDNEAQAGELLYQDLVRMAQDTNTLIFTATQLNRGTSMVDVKSMDQIEGSYRKKNTIAFGATINSSPEERQQGYFRLYLDKVRNQYGFDDQFLYLRYNRKSMRLHAETPAETEEHKTLVDASLASHKQTQQKFDKKGNMADIINSALKQ